MVEATRYILTLLTGTLLSHRPFALNPGFAIDKVALLSASLPSHSWEFGAAAQAMLELYNPLLSVFGPAPFPVQVTQKEDVKALAYAASKINIGTGANTLVDGDGAVGDPASLGVSAVMLGKTDQSFASAANLTVDYLLNSAPRYYNGAISQRSSSPELWADFIYMAPPFLAYYAADQGNEILLQETVKQCGYYREILQADTTKPYKGAWRHIIGPDNQDLGIWSTGNGWAAAGMTRVLATVMKAPIAKKATWADGAINDLTNWIMEILDGAMGSSMDGGLLRNYYDDLGARGFGEISGSSLLAAVVYRMATLRPDACNDKYINWADGIRKVLGGNDTNGNPHITADGIVTPAVNPLAWLDTTPYTTGSPEGQVFVVLMYAAWRDCVLVGTCKGLDVVVPPVASKRTLHANLRSRHR